MNRTELAGYVENATAMQKQLMHAREVAQAVADSKPLHDTSIELGYHGAELQSASHTTAELTGAFAFMSRDDVVKDARVHDRQATSSANKTRSSLISSARLRGRN